MFVSNACFERKASLAGVIVPFQKQLDPFGSSSAHHISLENATKLKGFRQRRFALVFIFELNSVRRTKWYQLEKPSLEVAPTILATLFVL